MAQRSSWGGLSPGYRARLERGGITRSTYESGASLSGARGHAHTPERPIARNEPVPKRYRKWFNNRYKTPIRMLAEDGDVILVSVSPKARKLIASHWNAVHASLYGKAMPHAWWYKGTDYLENLASFDSKSILGSELNDDGSIGPPTRYQFLTKFQSEDPEEMTIVKWSYGATASFGDIYQLQAA